MEQKSDSGRGSSVAPRREGPARAGAAPGCTFLCPEPAGRARARVPPGTRPYPVAARALHNVERDLTALGAWDIAALCSEPRQPRPVPSLRTRTRPAPQLLIHRHLPGARLQGSRHARPCSCFGGKTSDTELWTGPRPPPAAGLRAGVGAAGRGWGGAFGMERTRKGLGQPSPLGSLLSSCDRL